MQIFDKPEARVSTVRKERLQDLHPLNESVYILDFESNVKTNSDRKLEYSQTRILLQLLDPVLVNVKLACLVLGFDCFVGGDIFIMIDRIDTFFLYCTLVLIFKFHKTPLSD